MNPAFVASSILWRMRHAPVQVGSQVNPLVRNNTGKISAPRLCEVVLVRQHPEARSQIPLVTIRLSLPQ